MIPFRLLFSQTDLPRQASLLENKHELEAGLQELGQEYTKQQAPLSVHTMLKIVGTILRRCYIVDAIC